MQADVYGEEAASALRFLRNAMAPKPEPELPFQGSPATIYMDNHLSVLKVFQSLIGSLGVRVLTHMPPSEAERQTAARSRIMVERLSAPSSCSLQQRKARSVPSE